MDYGEYVRRLDDLRNEYGAAVKGIAGELSGIDLIQCVESTVSEYRFRARHLIEAYNA